MVALFLIHSFCNGITIGFMGASVSALFLTRYTPADIPQMYIVSTSMIFVTGTVYHHLSQRIAFRRLLTANLSFSFMMILTLTLAYHLIDDPFPALLLAASFELVWVMNSLEFWGLAGKLFDVREAKRLYGLMGAGEVVAIIISGFSIPLIVPFIGTENVLFIALTGTGLSWVMMRLITHHYAYQLPQQSDVQGNAPRPDALAPERHYILLIFMLVGLTISSLYVVDTAFYDQASQLYPDEGELASFLGIFFSVAGILQLASRTIFTGLLLRRYGVIIGLLVLPSLLILGGMGVFIGLGLGDAMVIVSAVILMKWVDRGLRFTLNQSTILILYQPLPIHQRVPVQARAESHIEAIAGFSVGVLLLFLTNTIGFGTVELILLLMVICVVWIGIVFVIRKPYVGMLVQTLTTQRLTTTDTMQVEMIAPIIGDDMDVESVHQKIIAEAEIALTHLENGAHDDLYHAKTRILRWVSRVVHPPELIFEIEQHILLPIKERRAYALEALDMLLMSPIKPVVMPLFEEIPPTSQAKKLREALNRLPMVD
ncbi:MAG: Npt1/Npt2 family nucleotide transporter [bacterium]|nr:Npt1/Npt2 family nucleotide transporter [bacterium]